ncbi:hypothetical protein OIDMADRAFT_17574 [Oidiodendron maius Zn]|uniref:Uncharacterized protein n=1 Tax=Oidiodendron maius (strain Zn) TaxID=913774 RepID=A0A0C3HQI6_OIDMZ|nr:hypothetical protein OIDMADRAFT_17574 [Oidiodendron maius Zn]
MLEQTTTRLHILEQDLIIERGKARLNTSQSDKDAEINSLQHELRLKQDIIDGLEKKYELLVDEVKSKDLKIKDLEAWKLRMKMMID